MPVSTALTGAASRPLEPLAPSARFPLENFWDARPRKSAYLRAPGESASEGYFARDGLVISRSTFRPMAFTTRSDARSKRIVVAVHNNSCEINAVGHDPINVARDHVVLLDERTAYELRYTAITTNTSIVIDHSHLSRPVARSAVDSGSNRPRCFFLNTALAKLLESIWALSQTEQFDRHGPRLVASFLDLMTAADGRYDKSSKATGQGSLRGRREQVKQYIREHCSVADTGIATIAAALGVTPRYIQMAFAQEGSTPLEYLRACRLELAAARLRDPVWNRSDIADIYFSCGFGSAGHFYAEFKQRYSMSPKQYRQVTMAG